MGLRVALMMHCVAESESWWPHAARVAPRMPSAHAPWRVAALKRQQGMRFSKPAHHDACISIRSSSSRYSTHHFSGGSCTRRPQLGRACSRGRREVFDPGCSTHRHVGFWRERPHGTAIQGRSRTLKPGRALTIALWRRCPAVLPPDQE